MKPAQLPTVTIVVPARNEGAAIEPCLAAIAQQDYPRDLLEVLVVDGASSDATRDQAEAALAGAGFARSRVLSNALGTTPSSLNLGLQEASGELLCRVDVWSFIPPNYVSVCAGALADPALAVVGGAQVAVARPQGSTVEHGIARALRNPYATGLARYRRRSSSGPGDTVYLGAFRRADLIAAGGWDARFLTNQDFELNQRLATTGTVWFEAGLEVRYWPRQKLGSLASQHRRFGRWKAATWLEGGTRIRPRQVVLLTLPPAAVLAALAVARRHPIATAAGGAVAALVVDGLGGERAAPFVRTASVAAMGVIAACWWLGVAEQFGRYAAGQRLLPGALTAPAAAGGADEAGAPATAARRGI